MLRRIEDDTLEALNLKMSEYDVLTALRRQGQPYQLTATELAHESLLSNGAMTHRIDRLEQRGFVEREADPDDRRGVLVRLTQAGRELVDKALEARLHLADVQIAALTLEERQAVSSSLRKVMAAAELSA
jgi:DNA-binding MarR family transcriptional regulator